MRNGLEEETAITAVIDTMWNAVHNWKVLMR